MVYQMNRAARDPGPARTGPRRADGTGDSADLRSQVKPAPFAYYRAHSVAEAVALLAELGDEAKILAGGLSLVPMMNFRLARPAALVDVSRIEGLSYLRAGAGDGLRGGALTTPRTVETCRHLAVLGGYGGPAPAGRGVWPFPLPRPGGVRRRARHP